MLYERLYRFLVELGARPAALDAETHDALLATVSHLPHVLANVLVSQAADALAAEDEGLPAAGPSFRDATRVAGANDAIWRDIYLANRDAVIERIDETVRRLEEVRAALQAADRDAVSSWNARAEEDRGAAGGGRRAARGPAPPGGF
jgi:prephenate dehydrogenase